MLSVILPSCQEEQNILHTAEVLRTILKRETIPYELIFVNDGSKDATWEKIKEAHQADPHVTGVNFTRNFGKEAAILAGLSFSKGDCCLVMDCDLQHPAETVPQMYRLWEEGYEVVEGVKKSRGNENPLHKACAGIFYKLMSLAAETDMARASDFKLLDRRVVDVLLAMPEHNSFFRALSSWVGYRTVQVEFDVQERAAGASKWSAFSLARYAVRNIAAFSSAPLQIVTFCGEITLLISIILGLQTLIRYGTGHSVEGFTTVILLILFIGSLLMISLGIIGFYLARIYDEIKCRPRYLIREVLNETNLTEEIKGK